MLDHLGAEGFMGLFYFLIVYKACTLWHCHMDGYNHRNYNK